MGMGDLTKWWRVCLGMIRYPRATAVHGDATGCPIIVGSIRTKAQQGAALMVDRMAVLGGLL